MTVLGIETATTVCAAAVVRGGKVLAEELIDQQYIHAEKLLACIDAALAGSNTSLEGIDGIAVSIGPGSFTGLRIGLSVAKGLAFAVDKPLIAVPTLVALARRQAEVGTGNGTTEVVAVLNSRRDEVYCQIFRLDGGEAHPTGEPRAMEIQELIDELGIRHFVITGEARMRVADAVRLHRGSAALITVSEAPWARCSGASIAQLGEKLLVEGVRSDIHTLEPMYIKEFFLGPRHGERA